MNDKLDVADEAVPYILLQRTETQSWFKNLRYILPKGRKIYNAVYNKLLYQVEALFRQEEIKDKYINKLNDEFQSIRPHLPEAPDKILDIGCGIGGMELFLSHYYEDANPHYYLLDKTEVSENVYYQFYDDAAYYNSLDVAGELLQENDVERERIHLLDADQFDLSELEDIDICFSFLSWAFHYPLETYLDEVLDCLKPEGKLALDLRKGTDAVSDCEQHFQKSKRINTDPKSDRYLFQSPLCQQAETPEETVA